MAWEWCHTSEAYHYAYTELMELPRETLLEILAEWRMRDKHPENDAAWPDQWPKALAFTEKLYLEAGDSSLVEAVWDRANDQRLCDSGGWNAWMCPYGCGPHCVDFGPSDQELHPRMDNPRVTVS